MNSRLREGLQLVADRDHDAFLTETATSNANHVLTALLRIVVPLHAEGR